MQFSNVDLFLLVIQFWFGIFFGNTFFGLVIEVISSFTNKIVFYIIKLDWYSKNLNLTWAGLPDLRAPAMVLSK